MQPGVSGRAFIVVKIHKYAGTDHGCAQKAGYMPNMVIGDGSGLMRCHADAACSSSFNPGIMCLKLEITNDRDADLELLSQVNKG